MDSPDAYHDEDAGTPELLLARNLPQSLHHVKVPVPSRLRPPNDKMQHHHPQRRNCEPKDAFPPHNMNWLNRRPLQQPLLRHELRRRKDLRTRDEQHPHDSKQRVRRVLRMRLLLVVGPYRAREPHDRHAGHDADERDPLVEEELPAEEKHAEEADEEDEGPARHLVYRGRDHQEARVHERRAADVAHGGDREEEDPVALEGVVLLKWGPDVRVVAGVVAGGLIGVGVDVGGVRTDGLVACGRGVRVLGGEAAVEGAGADDEPAAHFADEHLGCLEDGLVEVAPAGGVGVVAVAGALVVLGASQRERVQAGKGIDEEGRTWYLVRSVLQTPVTSIMATRNGMAALDAMARTSWGSGE